MPLMPARTPSAQECPGWAAGQPAGSGRGGDIRMGTGGGTNYRCPLHSSGHTGPKRWLTHVSDRAEGGIWTRPLWGPCCPHPPLLLTEPAWLGETLGPLHTHTPSLSTYCAGNSHPAGETGWGRKGAACRCWGGVTGKGLLGDRSGHCGAQEGPTGLLGRMQTSEVQRGGSMEGTGPGSSLGPVAPGSPRFCRVRPSASSPWEDRRAASGPALF